LRVTQNMLNHNLIFNLERTNRTMEKYQEQVSTGKKVSRPSDNPVTAVRGMYYRSSLNEIDQYKRNADEGLSWMSTTDEALGEVTSVLQRVRELTVQGKNGTNDESGRNAIAEEIDQLKAHLGEIANSSFGGRFVFAGTDVKTPPYREDTTIPNSPKEFRNTSEESLSLQVGPNNSVSINVLGKDIFNNDSNGGIFKVLSDIVSEFKNPTGSDTDHLSQLDSQMDNLLGHRAELGARMNRMELSISRLEGLEVSTTSLLSKEEDVDIARVIIDLKAQENVQRAALSIGAKIIQPSLVDFLR
jgi:flagellar hook-associated protein 3 FlgL